MKRWLPLLAILLLGLAAVIATEHRRGDTEIGPHALLGLIADSEREASRLPARATRMNDEEEIRIGDELASRYLAENELGRLNSRDAVVQAYVSRVGTRAASHARRTLPWRFHYIPDANFYDAFSLPGGHVFIGAGLMSLMRNEDELAAVLGHEIAHIELYHCAERVQLEAKARKLHVEIAGQLLALPMELFQAGYGKQLELEADGEGTSLAAQANYSPYGAITMFQALDRQYRVAQQRADSPQDEAARVVFATLDGYFRSHPPADERIAQIEQLIRREGWEARTDQQPLDSGVWSALHRREPPAEPESAPPRILR
ncbi:MAG: M48 family metalloprotease [Steroidobacteraceae bacterium]